MRYIILWLLMVYSTAAVAKGTDPLKPRSVDFCGREMFFAFSGKDFDEYIPQGESLDNWTHLASIRVVRNCSDPKKFARGMAELVESDNPHSQSAEHLDSRNQIAYIDFVTWPRDGAYVEFNIFRIEKSDSNCLIVYQYAQRAYKEQKKFLLELRSLREQTIAEMTDRGLTINKPRIIDKKISTKTRSVQR